MTGRKISAEEFIRNYTNAPKSGPEKRKRQKWTRNKKREEQLKRIQYEAVKIHNPVFLHYNTILKETNRAILFEFSADKKEWFPKMYCRVYTTLRTITVPMVFARERNLMTFQV